MRVAIFYVINFHNSLFIRNTNKATFSILFLEIKKIKKNILYWINKKHFITSFDTNCIKFLVSVRSFRTQKL